MIGITDIVSDPELDGEEDGFRVYKAEGDFGEHKRRVRVICLPIADGDFCPIKRGDRVLCGLGAGVAYVLRGPFVGNPDGVNATSRTIHPPRGGSEVRVGARTGGAWEAFMLYQRAHSDILEIKSSLNATMTGLIALANYLQTLPADSPHSGAAEAANVTALTDYKSDLQVVTGGQAASGAKGRPA